jgi:hypothetical protein
MVTGPDLLELSAKRMPLFFSVGKNQDALIVEYFHELE